jgi:hypothetical protein
LYPALPAEGGAEGGPDGALRAAWRQFFLGFVRRDARLQAQAAQILERCAADGLDAIPIKGLWLAARVYPDPACRPMRDLDFLARRADLPRITGVMDRLGYRPRGPADDGPFAYSTVFLPSAPDDLPIDFHWQFGSDTQPHVPRLEPAPLWEICRRGAPGDGPAALSLPAEAHLLLAAYHLLHHAYALPLRAYLDIALILARFGREMDRERLAALAERWGMERALALALAVTRELLGPLPPEMAEFARPADVAAGIVGDARDAVFAGRRFLAAAGETTLVEMSERTGGASLSFALRRVFMPAAFMRARYPLAQRGRTGLAAAYVQRAGTLLWRHGRDALALATGGGSERRARRQEAAARLRLVRWAAGRSVTPGPAAADPKPLRAPRSPTA